LLSQTTNEREILRSLRGDSAYIEKSTRRTQEETNGIDEKSEGDVNQLNTTGGIRTSFSSVMDEHKSYYLLLI
jgi:hypothetical protein